MIFELFPSTLIQYWTTTHQRQHSLRQDWSILWCCGLSPMVGCARKVGWCRTSNFAFFASSLTYTLHLGQCTLTGLRLLDRLASHDSMYVHWWLHLWHDTRQIEYTPKTHGDSVLKDREKGVKVIPGSAQDCIVLIWGMRMIKSFEIIRIRKRFENDSWTDLDMW